MRTILTSRTEAREQGVDYLVGTADLKQLTPQPLYGQVRRLLVERIQSGEWMVGDPLPNEGVLAKQFGVSVGTIRKAVEGLENNGLIKRIQGRGTYVAGIGSHVLRQKFTRLRSPDGQDVSVTYELVSLERAPLPDSVAKATGWPEGLEAYKVTQIVRFGTGGAGYEVSYFPANKLPSLHKNLTFGQDLYPLLADYGLIVTHARERLAFARLEDEVAVQLAASSEEPALLVTRLAYCMDKTPVEYRETYYLGFSLNYEVDIN